jgi:hypothetical protein
MDYNKLKRSAKVKSLVPLPEGYGRSVVGGRELITRPSQKAEARPKDAADAGEIYSQMSEQANDEVSRDSIGYVPDLSQSFEPDSRGFIGDYHKDDLKKQYEELMANNTAEDMDQILFDEEAYNEGLNLPYKMDKETGRASDELSSEEIEGTRYLGNAIRYGRMSDQDLKAMRGR